MTPGGATAGLGRHAPRRAQSRRRSALAVREPGRVKATDAISRASRSRSAIGDRPSVVMVGRHRVRTALTSIPGLPVGERIDGRPEPPRRSPYDEDIAGRVVNDLRADGAEHQSLQPIQSAAAHDDQVSVPRRVEKDVGGIAPRLDRLGLDPSRRQELACPVELAPPPLDLGWVAVRRDGDPAARVGLADGDDDDSAVIAGQPRPRVQARAWRPRIRRSRR